MPRTYKTADHDAMAVLDSVVIKYYKWISQAELTFDILMAHGPRNNLGEVTGPAVVLHGLPSAATVKINSLKQRVAGLNDVTIEIDGDKWPEWTAEQRSAVMDHELYHLEPRLNPDGSVKLDDCARPMLWLRKHDFEFGGFREIANRHRDVAFELKAVEEAYALICGDGGQLEWPWAAPKPNRKLASA